MPGRPAAFLAARELIGISDQFRFPSLIFLSEQLKSIAVLGNSARRVFAVSDGSLKNRPLN
jgi:hypothetical protein